MEFVAYDGVIKVNENKDDAAELRRPPVDEELKGRRARLRWRRPLQVLVQTTASWTKLDRPAGDHDERNDHKMNAEKAEGGSMPPRAFSSLSGTASSSAAMGSATPVTELDRVVAYANRFSLKLFKHVAALNPRSTVCIGPFAVFQTLCMAYAGAQGNTEHQIAKAFKAS
ncbi:hypothetical protein MTO96_028173 [Rhipicephalus appendiculatus]